MSYLYASNLDTMSGVNQIEIMLDSGDAALLTMGKRYDLTATEVTRASRFIILIPSALPAVEDPVGIVRLPIKGNPADSDVPMWDMNEAAFVPVSLAGAGAGLTVITSGLAAGDLVEYNGTNWVNKPPTSIPNLKVLYGLSGVAGGNSTALAQAVIDLGGKPGYLPAGTYDVDAHDFSAGLLPNLIGDPGQTIIRTPSRAQGFAGWSFTGSTVGGAYSLTANATAGDQTLQLSAANAAALGASAGDRLQVWSNLLWPTTVAQGAVQGEIVRVKSVNTTTGVLTIYGTLDDSYLTANVARVRKLAMARGGRLAGIEWASQTPAASASALLMLSWVEGFRCDDVFFRDGDGPGLRLNDCTDAYLDIRARDLPDNAALNQFGYGVLFYGATRDCYLHVRAQRVRHSMTTGGAHFSDYATNPAQCGVPAHIVVSGEAWETTAAGFDSHSEGIDIIFDGIHSHGCEIAWQVRAPNSTVMNWSQDNCRDTVYIAWTASHTRIFPGQSRRTKTSNGATFQIGTIGNLGTIDDVHVYGMSSDGEEITGARIVYATNVFFHQPHVKNPGAGAGDCFYVDVGCSGIYFIDATAQDALQLVGKDASIPATAIQVLGQTTLINTSRVALDRTIAYRRDTLDIVNASLGQNMLSVRRDDFSTNRDTQPRFAVDSSGVMKGSFDGTTAPGVQFWARGAAQWGMVGELRNVPVAAADVVISSRLAGEAANRWWLDGRGILTSGDGTNAATQKFSHNATTGDFSLDGPTMFAAAMKMHRRFVTATPDTVANSDLYLGVSTAGGAKTINLPAPSTGEIKIIKDESKQAATNNITIVPNGAQTVEGNANLVLNVNGDMAWLLGIAGTGWVRIV